MWECLMVCVICAPLIEIQTTEGGQKRCPTLEKKNAIDSRFRVQSIYTIF